jgi:hypothetical protein
MSYCSDIQDDRTLQLPRILDNIQTLRDRSDIRINHIDTPIRRVDVRNARERVYTLRVSSLGKIQLSISR